MVEQHSAMRFAWLRSQEDSTQLAGNTSPGRMFMIGYNVFWWVPVVLPVLGIISYRTGFVSFLLVTAFRAVVNLYRNNVLPIEVAQYFPLRLP